MKPGESVRWLTAQEAAAHLRLTMRGLYQFVARERKRKQSPLRVYWLRGRMRFRQVDLDRCLEPEPVDLQRRKDVAEGDD